MRLSWVYVSAYGVVYVGCVNISVINIYIYICRWWCVWWVTVFVLVSVSICKCVSIIISVCLDVSVCLYGRCSFCMSVFVTVGGYVRSYESVLMDVIQSVGEVVYEGIVVYVVCVDVYGVNVSH